MRETSIVRQMSIADVRLALGALPPRQADLVIGQVERVREILQLDLSTTLLLIAKASALVAEDRRFET